MVSSTGRWPGRSSGTGLTAFAAAAFGPAGLCRRRGRRAFLLSLQIQIQLARGGRRRGLLTALSKHITRQRRQLPGHRRQLLLKLRDALLLISDLLAGGLQLSHAAFYNMP